MIDLRRSSPRSLTTGENIRRSVAIFMMSSIAVLGVWALAARYWIVASLGRDLFFHTLPLVVVFCAFAMARPSLFRRESGQLAEKFEAANVLTAIRLFLVPPMLVFLSHGHLLWGSFIYGTILLTDVIDGYVARRFGQETVFGVMLDPFADIASTLAAFTWLYLNGTVPSWLLIILVVRYSEFFFGMILLAAIGRIPRLHATIAGKIAGLVQGFGILIFLFMEAFSPSGEQGVTDIVLFVCLAAAFISVILSQTWIGMHALKRVK